MGTFVNEGYIRGVAESHARMQHRQQSEDIDCAGSWILYFSDFQQTSPDLRLHSEAIKARDFATKHGINVFLLGAGDAVCEKTATALAQPGRPWVPIGLVDFDRFFAFLISAMRKKSMSGGQSITTAFNGISIRID